MNNYNTYINAVRNKNHIERFQREYDDINDEVKKNQLQLLIDHFKNDTSAMSGLDHINEYFSNIEKFNEGKSWNRLSSTYKMSKVKEFINNKYSEYQHIDDLINQIEYLIFNKKLNTSKHVEYDKENNKIIKMMCLEMIDDKIEIKCV